MENLKHSINRAKQKKNKVAILFIDIDNFKTINDSLGHDAGDQLIVQIAQRLNNCLRDEDTINRFGGDEFVSILQDIHNHSDIKHVTDRMLASLTGPIDIGMSEVYSSVCIGIALYPDDDDKGVNILKFEDAAMYHAKPQRGKN